MQKRQLGNWWADNGAVERDTNQNFALLDGNCSVGSRTVKSLVASPAPRANT
jgi:hypothetical protein